MAGEAGWSRGTPTERGYYFVALVYGGVSVAYWTGRRWLDMQDHVTHWSAIPWPEPPYLTREGR